MTEEQLYIKDLAIRHYPYKWQEAKRQQILISPQLSGIDRWLFIRRIYFELGGQYIEQLQLKERMEYTNEQ